MHAIDIVTSAALFLAALLYSSVGHGGASGYLAVMALTGIAPAEMRFAALTLNVVVAAIATFRFYRAGSFSHALFWPVALTSIPMAFVGGAIVLPMHLFKPLLGIVLLYAGWRSFSTAPAAGSVALRPVKWTVLAPLGAVLGLLSGLTGVGGGIFLSPILIFFRWAPTKTVSGVAAAFILVNSIAGLAGQLTTKYAIPSSLPVWIAVVVVGGYIGATLGSKRLGNPMIQRLLALVLVIAGFKMLFT
ncbi:sulfite exporter TauE/SafE family protein [Ramlibacter sp. PS4R-6]|uniref:sulfite exporter TauE/SafE family protein n=1 Tax=Ramlibacter sp. PS4R-6 TaxID=3133438 RepID=UPI003096FEA4